MELIKLKTMKKIILLLSISILSFTQLNAQKSYWACMGVTVDNWGQQQFVEAMDNFMNSEAGKSMPYTVTLSEISFTNGDFDSTHQLCFIGQSADAFANWTSGPPPTIEGLALFVPIDKYVEFDQIILGSPLVFNPENLANNFSVVWAMNVSDPAKFVNAFSEFNQNLNGGFELHEAIIGAQKGVTHYLVARQTNLAEWLKGREGVLNSGAGAQFQSSSQGAVDIMFNVGLNLIKSYNQD